MNGAQVIRLAGRRAAANDFTSARTMLHMVLRDREPALRAEARFQLARLAEKSGDLAGAERWYRALLDEQPAAAGVRLELGRVLAEQRKLGAAARELRRAHAAGLPPEVAKTVERLVSTLRHDAPFGGSLEIAFAPDSNINRATRSETVTAFGLPFTLDENARGRSGVGLAYTGQVFLRRPLGRHRFAVSLGAQGNRYRDADASDLNVSLSVGPQFRLGRLVIGTSAVAARGWQGGEHATTDLGLDLKARMSVGKTSALAFNATATSVDNRRSSAASGAIFSGQAAFEKALSPRLYARATASLARVDARSGALSSWIHGGGVSVSRQFGPLTGYVGADVRRVEGDQPFLLFGQARRDTLVQGTLGVILRPLTIGGFAPVVRMTHARNSSPIEIYGYKRTRAEFGITRDF